MRHPNTSRTSFQLLQSTTFVLPCSGHAPGLSTDLNPTLHRAIVQLATNTIVVGGKDAEEPDPSKTLLHLYSGPFEAGWLVGICMIANMGLTFSVSFCIETCFFT